MFELTPRDAQTKGGSMGRFTVTEVALLAIAVALWLIFLFGQDVL
jgi:hypothetical protein